jgi:hypothetical protein
MIKSRSSINNSVSFPEATWKSKATETVYNANSSKFYTLFTPKQQDYIKKKLINAKKLKISNES